MGDSWEDFDDEEPVKLPGAVAPAAWDDEEEEDEADTVAAAQQQSSTEAPKVRVRRPGTDVALDRGGVRARRGAVGREAPRSGARRPASERDPFASLARAPRARVASPATRPAPAPRRPRPPRLTRTWCCSNSKTSRTI